MSTDHFQPDLASNAASFTSATPTFTPDGSRLAWAEKDGVHFANTSDLGSCSAVTDGLLVAGAAYPFFGKADMSATAGVSQTGTQGAQSAHEADGEVAVSMVAANGDVGSVQLAVSCGAEIAGVSPCRPPRPARSLARAWPDGPPERRAPAGARARTPGGGRPGAPRTTETVPAGGS